MNKGQVIKRVLPDSIGEELEISPGDRLLTINDQPVADVFDYRFLCSDEELRLLLRTPDGEEYLAEVEKDYDEDLGLEFEEGLMDEAKSCSNHCIFCFIDQMPPGMRSTLYFKDDDARLSFLQGNYVTLTNMKDQDIERICRYHLSPINVSVQTTDLELRKKMLHNRFADRLMGHLDRLAAAHITMNFQVVLCKGVNDGKVLDKTIADLSAYIPAGQSLSVVPVGLSRFREGLYPLEPFDPADAAAAIDLIEGWQKKLLDCHGTRFVFAADEFYLKAGRDLPPFEAYEDFYQLENGVGMLRLFETEFLDELEAIPPRPVSRQVSLVTGQAPARVIQALAEKAQGRFPGLRVRVFPIVNHFFGPTITVSGLLTGQDILKQLSGKDLGQEVLLPGNLLRSGTDTLLDDKTVPELAAALGVPVRSSGNTGDALLHCLLEGGNEA